MGRELRMVPPNWQHPISVRSNGQEGYQPMHKETFAEAMAEWKKGFAAWERGERPSYFVEDDETRGMEYHEYSGGPPDRKYYQTWDDNDATWYQVWETVSEGTPVTPPFETKEELIEYLVSNGDFWDQKRRQDKAQGRHVLMRCEPWSRREAESFVNGPGWAPSFVADSNGMRSGVEALAEIESKPKE